MNVSGQRLYRAVFKGDWSDTLLPQKLPMSVVYTIAVVYTLAMMVNFLGCLLLFTASLEDSEFEGTWIEGHVGTDFENYLTSIYWAVTTVRNSAQMSWCSSGIQTAAVWG